MVPITLGVRVVAGSNPAAPTTLATYARDVACGASRDVSRPPLAKAFAFEPCRPVIHCRSRLDRGSSRLLLGLEAEKKAEPLIDCGELRR